MLRFSLLLLGTVPLAFLGSAALALTIAQHTGATDPTTEGWTAAVGSGWTGTVGESGDDATPSWDVDDNSTALNTIYLYQNVVTSTEIALGNANGWTLSTALRISSDAVRTVNGSPVVAYRDGTKSWQMNFGLDSAGDTTVQLVTGLSPSVQGPVHTISGNAAYNSFTLIFDPLAGDADLFVNGSEVISNYAGVPVAQSWVIWGAGRSPDQGQGNFNAVSFSVVPEPNTALLLAAGLAGLAAAGRRRSFPRA